VEELIRMGGTVMAGWGMLVLGAALIWFSTTYDHTAVGMRSSSAVMWIGVLTIVGFLADLFLALRQRSREKK
jgi:hypothetical protein